MFYNEYHNLFQNKVSSVDCVFPIGPDWRVPEPVTRRAQGKCESKTFGRLKKVMRKLLGGPRVNVKVKLSTEKMQL